MINPDKINKNMVRCFMLCVICWFCPIANAAQFKFVSITFDEDGAPASITCKFLIPFDKVNDLTSVLLAPDRIEYGPAKFKISEPRDGQSVVEACIDLSQAWVSRTSKPLAEGDWKLPIIDGKKSQIVDNMGFVKVLEISDSMQVGFCLGRADLNEDVKAFLKMLDERGAKHPKTDGISPSPSPKVKPSSK